MNQDITSLIRPTLQVKPSAIRKAREAGAEIVNLWVEPFGKSSYEGKKKHKDDYLYGIKAICDKVDLICLLSK